IRSFLHSNARDHRARRVMSCNSADRAAAQRARSAEKHVFVFGLYAPGAGLLFALGKRKRRSVLKDVPMVHSQRVLDIDRALAFDAGTAITRNGKTIFNRFFQPLVYTFQEFFFLFSS